MIRVPAAAAGSTRSAAWANDSSLKDLAVLFALQIAGSYVFSFSLKKAIVRPHAS